MTWISIQDGADNRVTAEHGCLENGVNAGLFIAPFLDCVCFFTCAIMIPYVDTIRVCACVSAGRRCAGPGSLSR